jgi:hypothetical protein
MDYSRWVSECEIDCDDLKNGLISLEEVRARYESRLNRSRLEAYISYAHLGDLNPFIRWAPRSSLTKDHHNE